jgi:hypothetical protein
MPIVTANLITVLPGETIMVEATLDKGRLTNLTAVERITRPRRTLVFTLTQEPSIGDGLGMLLRVRSRFPGVLKYRLGLMLPADESLRQTSSCPLKEGVTARESWPFPVFQVIAADFRQVDPNSEAARRCD